MLPNEKQLKSLISKIRKNVDAEHEKKAQINVVEEVQEISEDTRIFREMKKLPFSE